MPCAAPCDWVPCSRRCEKAMSCGHQCPSLCGEICPGPGYCQVCGPDDVKSTCVDFLEMKEYREIDLDKEPCVFPDCGHFLTVSSMDGQMNMVAHYELDASGLPAEVLGVSEPFSTGEEGIRVCPSCRGSLRSISRYGRIVRRGMLDEGTKKFISWSNSEYLKLIQQLVKEQEKLRSAPLAKAASSSGQPKKQQALTRSRLGHLVQLQQQLAGNSTRYAAAIALWHRLSGFRGKVRKEEQPFQRVADLVRHANRQNRTKLEFKFDESAIQVKGSLLATALLLRCDIIVLSDFFRLHSDGKLTVCPTKVKIDWSIYVKECANLISSARSAVLPREEVQGHIFAAQIYVFSQSFSSPVGDSPDQESAKEAGEASQRLKEAALEHINQARLLMDKYPSVAVLADEIEQVERMVNSGVFYREVTKDEMRAVYEAMAQELRGTGHWYTCENNHPFTVGDCGMPMEEAGCPECGAKVGGRDHVAAQGVRHAREIDQLARDVGRLAV
ncbi:hypothetical protein B0H67DRAFT_600984 [Lasiosphaeris hirsuta]|uniref:RZ-type domain-containing protein n=1 Tax=Lasiosphaeris hirsuta TaxID=260670 RepID=A0AA40AGC1_9PEZI|nr:hypothetical protein B0H67DRAFT_600984 [Lasiosphaeris hirsuta]